MQHSSLPIFNGIFTFSTKDRPNLPAIRDIPVFCFLIRKNDGSCVLVDSGLSPEYLPSVEGFVEQKENQRLDRSLAALGVEPGQVKTIIQTHLHWDHTAGMALFPGAEIIVQAAELQSLCQLKPYEDTYYYYDAWYNELPRMRVVNGNTELEPGLELIFTASHTPGHQIVRVLTSHGHVILAGDLSSNYDDLWWKLPEEFWLNLKAERPQRYNWQGEFLPAVRRLLEGQNMWEAQPGKGLGWRDLKRKGERIILSHDPELCKREFDSGGPAAIY